MQRLPYVDIMTVQPAVTGSMHPVIVKLPNRETYMLVVDCGLFHEKEYENLNYDLPFHAENVDFVFVTHNHTDHTGRLPLLAKEGFYGKVFTSEETAKLLPIALEDTCKILKNSSKRKGSHQKGNKKCLYNQNDVENILRLVNPQKFNETFKVNRYIDVTFLKNAHIPGAAMILIQIDWPKCEEKINLLFTGDYGDQNIFLDVEDIPKWVLELPLTIIQESTYGDMDSTEIKPCFERNVAKCVNSGGSVIAPVFSLQRSQEILYVMKKMQENRVLDINVPIYLDGKLAQKYTSMYMSDALNVKPEMRDFTPQNLHFVYKDTRKDVLHDRNPKIVLTTSGMGSYGPAQTYIPEYLTRKDALIHFTGYTAEGTLGRRLKETLPGEIVEVGGVLVRKYATVEYTSEYSAHAKADKMIAFLKQFKDLKLILLNHGEPKTKEIFAKRIMNEVKPKMVGILGREFYFRVNPYGYVKSLSSRWSL